MSTVPSNHELLAREAKCRKIAAYVLREAARLVITANSETWQNLAAKAGTNLPSETSRKRIIELLEGAKLP